MLEPTTCPVRRPARAAATLVLCGLWLPVAPGCGPGTTSAGSSTVRPGASAEPMPATAIGVLVAAGADAPYVLRVDDAEYPVWMRSTGSGWSFNSDLRWRGADGTVWLADVAMPTPAGNDWGLSRELELVRASVEGRWTAADQGVAMPTRWLLSDAAALGGTPDWPASLADQLERVESAMRELAGTREVELITAARASFADEALDADRYDPPIVSVSLGAATWRDASRTVELRAAAEFVVVRHRTSVEDVPCTTCPPGAPCVRCGPVESAQVRHGTSLLVGTFTLRPTGEVELLGTEGPTIGR